jgi:hypothetical protein
MRHRTAVVQDKGDHGPCAFKRTFRFHFSPAPLPDISHTVPPFNHFSSSRPPPANIKARASMIFAYDRMKNSLPGMQQS